METRPTEMEKRVGVTLVQGAFVKQEELDRAFGALEAGTSSSLREALVASGILTNETFAVVLSFCMRVPIVSLAEVVPEPRALELIPQEDARRLRVLPLSVGKEGNTLRVAMELPEPELIKELIGISVMRIRPCVLLSGVITNDILGEYYGKS